MRGAEPWVGRAAWNFGSYYLWGDVPALMPKAVSRGIKNAGGSWFRESHNKVPHSRGDALRGVKNGGDWFGSGENASLQRRHGSGSTKRKEAAALVAKIPLELSTWIGRAWLPQEIAA